ncbi:MAG: macro domain-containing protein, partial [Ruminococcus sp.]
LKCAEIMKKQGQREETGKAKLTPAYNLPCKYVLHTVGPIIRGKLTKQDCDLLASCYRSCLKLAEENEIESIAFCCISTGEFHFSNDKAAEIAFHTVKEFKQNTCSKIKVVFNVFKDMDYEIYRELLG